MLAQSAELGPGDASELHIKIPVVLSQATRTQLPFPAGVVQIPPFWASRVVAFGRSDVPGAPRPLNPFSATPQLKETGVTVRLLRSTFAD